jgi:N-glycosylase/DNA lyase
MGRARIAPKRAPSNFPVINRTRMWDVVVIALLSMQSRPWVVAFLNTPASSALALSQAALPGFSQRAATAIGSGGSRFKNRIAGQLVTNHAFLSNGGWQLVSTEEATLRQFSTNAPPSACIRVERQASNWAASALAGFGPKQSLHFWQTLGLTRYEIPLDSWVTGWLNSLPLPFRVPPTTFGERDFYQWILDGVQVVRQRAGVYPTLLNAALF